MLNINNQVRNTDERYLNEKVITISKFWFKHLNSRRRQNIMHHYLNTDFIKYKKIHNLHTVYTRDVLIPPMPASKIP